MDRKLYDTAAAASYLGTTPATLRKSRVTGELWGLPSPAYLKAGHRCFYTLPELDRFIGQLTLYSSTAEARVAAQGAGQ